jgi:hypothetical protein
LALTIGYGSLQGPQEEVLLPPNDPDESKAIIKNKLGIILRHAEKHPVMELDEAARARFDDWYLNRPRSVHGRRIDTYALRFMSILAVNDLKKTVDMATVEKVIALCEHQIHLRQLHDP